jgi:hypothetical protein
MPLPAYGVLVGTLNHFTREDPNNSGSWYYGKLYVDTPAGQYEGAVDVSTPSGIKVQYRLVRHLSRPALSGDHRSYNQARPRQTIAAVHSSSL